MDRRVALPAALGSLYWCRFNSCLGNSLRHSAYLGLFGAPMGVVLWLIARPDREAAESF